MTETNSPNQIAQSGKKVQRKREKRDVHGWIVLTSRSA
jgi:hypothetical protein